MSQHEQLIQEAHRLKKVWSNIPQVRFIKKRRAAQNVYGVLDRLMGLPPLPACEDSSGKGYPVGTREVCVAGTDIRCGCGVLSRMRNGVRVGWDAGGISDYGLVATEAAVSGQSFVAIHPQFMGLGWDPLGLAYTSSAQYWSSKAETTP